jgi:hypothetical protein
MTNLKNQTISLELALSVLNSMEIASHLIGSLQEQIHNAKTVEEKNNLEELKAKQQKEVNELKNTLIMFSTRPNTTYSVKGTRRGESGVPTEPYLIYGGWETPHQAIAEIECNGCNRQYGNDIEFVVIENQK